MIISDDEDDDEIIPPTPEPAVKDAANKGKPGRRRVRKMVEKQIVDEDGFTTTKTQMESCSESDDNEGEEKPVLVEKKVEDSKKVENNKPVIKEPPAKKTKPPVTKKKGAAAGKQASIMNFFSKK